MFYKRESGYSAPSTEDVALRDALLDMPKRPYPKGLSARTEFIALWADVHVERFEGDTTVTRIHDGESGGATELYGPGMVLKDGSVTLKPHANITHIDLLFSGFDWSLGRFMPHLRQALPLSRGMRLFRKTFGVCRRSITLETKTIRKDRAVDIEALGLPGIPFYAYGGILPPNRSIDEAETVFMTPKWHKDRGETKTIISLVRQSEMERRGAFPPDPFYFDNQLYCFQGQKGTSFHTLGGDIVGGSIEIKSSAPGRASKYVSRGYQVWGGDVPRLKIFLENQTFF